MEHRNTRTSSKRIIFTGIVLSVFVTLPMIFAFYLHSKRVMIESHLVKARAVCFAADSFNSTSLCQFMPAFASDNSFDLNFASRRSLSHKHLSNNDPIDFHAIDRSENLLLYTHFIQARKTCLDCHGDPGKSKKAWANLNSTKGLSGDLIGWSEGDVCGAYEFSASLSGGDKKVAFASAIAALMLLAGGSIYMLGFLAASSCGAIQSDQKENDDEMACLDSEIFNFGQTDKVSHQVH